MPSSWVEVGETFEIWLGNVPVDHWRVIRLEADKPGRDGTPGPGTTDVGIRVTNDQGKQIFLKLSQQIRLTPKHGFNKHIPELPYVVIDVYDKNKPTGRFELGPAYPTPETPPRSPLSADDFDAGWSPAPDR